MMLASGDVPAGFEHSAAGTRWLLPPLDGSARRGLVQAGPTAASVLIAIMSEASLMVTMCDDAAEVEPISDATIEWIARLTS